MTIREGRGRLRFEALYETLRERISQLQYPPGTNLTEKALAAEFGVSRSPIRRALQALEADHLVETRVGVGTFVTSIDVRALRDAYALRMHLAELIGMFPPDEPLDCRVPAFAALEDRTTKILYRRDFKEFTRINNSLVTELGRCTGNTALSTMSRRLFYETIRMYYQLVRDNDADWTEEILATREEINEILKCVRARDGRAIGLTRRNYISFNLGRVLRLVLDDHEAREIRQ